MSDAAEDRLFERWCRRGDAEALAELFDRVAPRLLRLAVHLVGEAAEAEDLVQSTFVAAIERRESVDATRPALPWLTGVLAHKARQHRRRAARVPDPRRLECAAVEDPSRPLERRELDGELAAAIDALGEPYREVLVLRLRHGMELADVAHVLERDPGTVRVQFHRGLERLRERLPGRLASALAVVLVPARAPRGLDVVREAVVGRAAAATAAPVGAAGTAIVVGGALVGKKLGIVTAAAVLVALGWLWRSSGAGRAPAQGSTAAPAPADASLAAAPEVVERATPEPVAAEREPAPPAARLVRGRVVDAETGAPLAGAELRLFAPRAATALELVREQPELYELETDGRLRARTWGDWPRITGDTAASRFGREPVRVLGRPLDGEPPLASTRSARDGRFALPTEAVEGLLEGAHPGHATRWRQVEAGSELELRLWAEREVRGTVFCDGAPVTESLELVLTAASFSGTPLGGPGGAPRETDSAGGPRFVPYVPQVHEGVGAWTVRTDDRGGFRALVGARSVRVGVLTPGWARQEPVGVQDVGEEPLVVAVTRAPTIRFLDAHSGVPVERVRLLGREPANGYVRWAGEFQAPGGVLVLPGSFSMAALDGALRCTAWSEGYAATPFAVSDPTETEVVDVALEPGPVETLRGVVLGGGEPLEGAEVALLGHDRLQWGVDQDFLVDALTTGSDGTFALSAPAGSYVLRVREDDGQFLETLSSVDQPFSRMQRAIAGREPSFAVVELPAAAMTIDLDATSTLEVEIVDSHGAPLAEHIVVLQGDGGRQHTAHTDAQGLVGFPRLPAGRFRLHTPPVTAKPSFSFGGGEQREVDLAAAAVQRVRIVLAAYDGPRAGRVLLQGVIDYSAWRARFDGDSVWSALEPDGTLPLDLATDRYAFQVREPEGRTWTVDVPKEVPDGHVFELGGGGARYGGRIERADGTPWSGVTVHAIPWGATERPRVAALADADGAFEVAGLASAEYRLLFTTRRDDSPWSEHGNDLAGLSFLPREPPSADGTWLAIRVEEPAETLHLAGVVERADGTPVSDARLSFECDVPLADGVLRLGGRRAYTVDERGRFDVRVPRTPRVTVRVYGPAGTGGPLLTRELASERDDGELRLVVP